MSEASKNHYIDKLNLAQKILAEVYGCYEGTDNKGTIDALSTADGCIWDAIGYINQEVCDDMDNQPRSFDMDETRKRWLINTLEEAQNLIEVIYSEFEDDVSKREIAERSSSAIAELAWIIGLIHKIKEEVTK